jgi:hypothetical protein
MRTIWLVLVMVLTLTTVAVCDTVVIDGIESADVKVTGVDDCQLTLVHPGGNDETTNLASVESIELELEPTFNEAEVLAAAGKTDEAMAKYKDAFRATTELWVRELCELRRYQAANAGAKIDQAAEIWTQILTDNAFSDNAAMLIPTDLAAQGDDANTQALETLDALRQIDKVTGNDALWGSITQLMIAIAKVEGDGELELDLSDQLLGRLDVEGPMNAETLAFRLTVAESKIRSGAQAEGGVELITADLQQYPSDLLSRALFARAQGYEALAESSEDASVAREMHLDACIDYMYIVVFFPYETFAPEAAFKVGDINESLGHMDVAIRAYEMLAVGRIGSEHPDSDYVVQAEAAIERIHTQDDPLPDAE